MHGETMKKVTYLVGTWALQSDILNRLL